MEILQFHFITKYTLLTPLLLTEEYNAVKVVVMTK